MWLKCNEFYKSAKQEQHYIEFEKGNLKKKAQTFRITNAKPQLYLHFSFAWSTRITENYDLFYLLIWRGQTDRRVVYLYFTKNHMTDAFQNASAASLRISYHVQAIVCVCVCVYTSFRKSFIVDQLLLHVNYYESCRKNFCSFSIPKI